MSPREALLALHAQPPPTDADDLRRRVSDIFQALAGLSGEDLREDRVLEVVVAWLESPLQDARHETVRVYPDSMSDWYELEEHREVRSVREAAQKVLQRAGAAALPALWAAEAGGSQAAGALLEGLDPARVEQLRALREQQAREKVGAKFGPAALPLWDLCAEAHGHFVYDRREPFRRTLHTDDLQERLQRLWGGPLEPRLFDLLLAALASSGTADLAVAVLDRCPPALHPRLQVALRAILGQAARAGDALPTPKLLAVLIRLDPSTADRDLLLRLGLHPAAPTVDRMFALAALAPITSEGEAPQALIDLAFGAPRADFRLVEPARKVLLRCNLERYREGLVAALDRQEVIVLSHTEEQAILALGPRAIPFLPALLRSGNTSLVSSLLATLGASPSDILRLAARVAQENLLARDKEGILLALLHASLSSFQNSGSRKGAGLGSPYGETVQAALQALADGSGGRKR